MTWLDAEEKFAEHFPGYQPRESQRGGAQAIEAAWADGAHVLIQAPTGVGKSYLGSVPAVDAAFDSGLPTAIFTANKAQQDQYIRDLTRLGEIYRPFEFVLVKGRGNYVCEAKLNENGLELDASLVDLRAELALDGATGDMDQLLTPITTEDRGKLSTSSDECPGQKACSFGQVCWAERVKTRAKTAQIVVTNHSFGILDAQIKAEAGYAGAGMLPPYAHRLIDEGHELQRYATSVLGEQLTERQILRLLTDVTIYLKDSQPEIRDPEGMLLPPDPTLPSVEPDDVIKPVMDLFAQLNEMLTRATETSLVIDAAMLLAIADNITTAFARLRSLHAVVKATDVWGDDERAQKKKRLVKRIATVGNTMLRIFTSKFTDMVRWIERTTNVYRGKQTSFISLKYAPLSVAEPLKRVLWDGVPTAIMSATMAIGDDFTFVMSQLGMPEDAHTFDAPSPYDFARQALIYVPEIADPGSDKDGWQVESVYELAMLAKQSQGRLLGLFTSREEMNRAYRTVAPQLAEVGLSTLKQGDQPNQMLRDRFTAEEHTSLFGLASFGTGFDVAGRSLENLFINKLPFPNGNDIIFQARCDLIDSTALHYGQQSFSKLWIPTMSLDLLQWAGRGVRSSEDRVLITVADPRLMSKAYGKKVIKALEHAMPGVVITRDRRVAMDYLRSLDEVRDVIAV